MRRFWTGLALCAGFFVLILDAKTALSGATDGLQLCIQTVIPALFPFFFLSIQLTNLLMGKDIPFLAPVYRFCRMPKGTGPLLTVGLLGGYPIGAQVTASAYRQSRITKADALRLLGFCSNAGPSFLFGIVAKQFSDSRCVWLLWLIHILSCMITARILPGKSAAVAVFDSASPLKISEAFDRSLRAIAAVCGWVVLFRVLIAVLDRWILWLLPDTMHITIVGILELTNGCCQLDMIENEGLRFIICSAILAFGGICVLMQTVSVSQPLGLGMYFPGKLLQCGVSVLLSCIVQSVIFAEDAYAVSPVLYISPGILMGILTVILRIRQKNSSNPVTIGV